MRPPVGSAKPSFAKSFDAARAKSATEAASFLRTQGAFLARTERAAMLNHVAHQMLRQPQPASLAELRRLHADWHAIGPGAGLDPVLAMELEAAESGAERLLLAEILKLVADGQFAAATKKFSPLESPRFLPAAAVQTLPELLAVLHRAAPAREMQVTLSQKNPQWQDVARHVTRVAPDAMPAAVRNSLAAWGILVGASEVLGVGAPGRRSQYKLADFERVLGGVATVAGDELARRLRADAAAALFLDGRPGDAAELLEGEVDPIHTAAVLADLRAALLGRGELTTGQVAALIPPGAKPPTPAAAILPPDQLAKWKPPARKGGETTLDVGIADARNRLKAAIDAEVSEASGKVNAAADRVRAALAAEAAPVKAFVEKVQAARGGEALTAAERQLAAVAGSRGLTVAETIGVLSAEADRPAAAARLLGAVPAFADPGAFAVRVEVAGRAPAAFKSNDAADFRLTGVRDRARVRDAVAAILGAQAAKAAAGQSVEPVAREALEAEVAKRLGLAPAALAAAECVQALFDVCRDWAEDHERLRAAARALDEVIADIESGRYDPEDGDARDVFTLAKVRRLTVQNDRKRREAGIASACQLLGGYGSAAKPAAAWLGSQGQDKPWRGVAVLNYARIMQEK